MALGNETVCTYTLVLVKIFNICAHFCMHTTRSVTAVRGFPTAASIIMLDTSNSLSFTLIPLLSLSLYFTSTLFTLVLYFESPCEFSDLSKRSKCVMSFSIQVFEHTLKIISHQIVK